MSDEGISTTEFTSSRISFSSELQPRDDEQILDEDAAVRLLATRFNLNFKRSTNLGEDIRTGLGAPYYLAASMIGGPNSDRLSGQVIDESKQAAGNDLLRRIVRMLPETHLTTSVLSHVDLRPILAELEITEDQARRTSTVHYVNDVPVLPQERVVAGLLLNQQQDLIADQAQLAAAALEQQGEFDKAADPAMARQQFLTEAIDGWKSANGELGAAPSLVIETQEGETIEARDEAQAQLEKTGLLETLYMDTGIVDGTGTPYGFVSEDDIINMFQMNAVDWDLIMRSERDKFEARSAGQHGVPDYFRVDTGGLITDSAGFTDTSSLEGIERASTRDARRIRLLDVFNSLYSSQRTPDELRNLQDKLIAGGYLDEDDVRYWGRANDEATVSAWRNLIRDSISLRKDMTTVLKESTLSKREEDEENAKKFQRDLVLTSSIGIQTTADALGQQVIGRKLSGDQHARLIEFIHQLETDTHKTLDPDGGQVAEEVDVNAEVEAWIERENSTEAGAYDLLEQFDVFNQIARRSG